MKRSITFLIALALGLGLLPHALAETYGEGPFARSYFVHNGSTAADGLVPLVVYLHGCLQDGAAAETGTKWSKLADELHFAVVYPSQDTGADDVDTIFRSLDGSANGTGCWNWFRPEAQERDAGEPGAIAGITREVMASYNIDPRYVFVIGASAGADMAVTLAATYPDLYTGFGPILGCPYRACTDVTGRLAWEAMGANARAMPAFIVDGTLDELNPFVQSQNLVSEWLGVADLADNGSLDGTVPRTPSSFEHYGIDQTPSPGSGDPCVRNEQWPCVGGVVGFQETYPYSVFHYTDIDFWLVHGLGHDYPYGDPDGNFTDPLGPDITKGAYDFMVAHPGPLGVDFGSAPFATKLAAGGARHLMNGAHLGPLVAADTDGPASGDEDGVRIVETLTAGKTTSVQVAVTAPTKLDAWIDFNADGDWDDTGEHVAASVPLQAGANTLAVSTPAGAVVGDSYARFRVSDAGGLQPTGYAPTGEVEDYKVTIKAPPKPCKPKRGKRKC